MMGRLVRWSALVSLLAVMAGGCGGNLAAVRHDLEVAEATWSGERLSQYVIEYERRCLCGNAGRFVARVEGGAVVAVDPAVGIGGDEELPFAFTVERLFDTIRSAIDREPDDLEVVYDAGLGYPAHISIDADTRAEDDELVIIAQVRADD